MNFKNIIIIGLLVSTLGLLTLLVICKNNNNNENKPYTYELPPPAPPYQKAQVLISQIATEGCDEVKESMIGYIISIEEDKVSDYDILFEDENRVRHQCYIDMSTTSNADRSWLPVILIPGNKVEMKVQYCGSAGFTYIMEMKNLERK